MELGNIIKVNKTITNLSMLLIIGIAYNAIYGDGGYQIAEGLLANKTLTKLSMIFISI
jgi:hypothetical protein